MSTIVCSVLTGHFLGLDGVLCMRLLAQNTMDIVTAEIVSELFKKWKKLHSGDGSTRDSTKALSDETN